VLIDVLEHFSDSRSRTSHEGLQRRQNRYIRLPSNLEETSSHTELSAIGVEFTMTVTEMPWGDKGAEIVDLDGNRFYINEGE
jgi:uncharacterized glyoxalase superfamily protein PhnB